MLDLTTLANMAEVIGLLVVVGSIIFALKQLQHFRLQHEVKTAIELSHLLQKPEFIRALRLLLEEPPESLENAHDIAFNESAMFIILTLESIGLMVHRRIVSLNIVWELMGGLLLLCWLQLQPWVAKQRIAQDSEKFAEWGQWLIEQMQSYQKKHQHIPAYQGYANWKP